MNRESLDEMIFNNDNNEAEEEKQDNDQQDQKVENNVQNIEGEVGTIPLTNFSDWFRQYNKSLDNVSNVRADIKHVDPRKNLIITVWNNSMEERDVYAFRKANELPVLDLTPYEMKVFENNTFQINYQYSDLILKAYNLKNKLIIFPSHVVDDLIIPYNKLKVTSQDDQITIPSFDRMYIDNMINNVPNMNRIILRYKQMQKYTFNTIKEVFNFLNSRQSQVYDVNHLIQIDDVMYHIVTDL